MSSISSTVMRARLSRNRLEASSKISLHDRQVVVGLFSVGVVIVAISQNVSIPICYNKALEI